MFDRAVVLSVLVHGSGKGAKTKTTKTTRGVRIGWMQSIPKVVVAVPGVGVLEEVGHGH